MINQSPNIMSIASSTHSQFPPIRPIKTLRGVWYENIKCNGKGDDKEK